MNGRDFQRVMEGVHRDHREQIGKLAFQVAIYRKQLEDAGIQPDDLDDGELLRLWRASARMITTASEAAAFVLELGSEKELLADWARR